MCSVFDEAGELLPRGLGVALPLDSQLNDVFVFNTCYSVSGNTVNSVPAALFWLVLRLFLSRNFFFGLLIFFRVFSLPNPLRPRISFAEIVSHYRHVSRLGPMRGFEVIIISLIHLGLLISPISHRIDHFNLAWLWMDLILGLRSFPEFCGWAFLGVLRVFLVSKLKFLCNHTCEGFSGTARTDWSHHLGNRPSSSWIFLGRKLFANFDDFQRRMI